MRKGFMKVAAVMMVAVLLFSPVCTDTVVHAKGRRLRRYRMFIIQRITV